MSRANRALTLTAMASRARARAASFSLFTASAAGSFTRFLLAFSTLGTFAAAFSDTAESAIEAEVTVWPVPVELAQAKGWPETDWKGKTTGVYDQTRTQM